MKAERARGLLPQVFLSQNRLQEATYILLEALTGDRPEDAALQTKLLEMNLLQQPQVWFLISEKIDGDLLAGFLCTSRNISASCA